MATSVLTITPAFQPVGKGESNVEDIPFPFKTQKRHSSFD